MLQMDEEELDLCVRVCVRVNRLVSAYGVVSVSMCVLPDVCVRECLRVLVYRTKLPAAFISALVVLQSVSAADSRYQPQPHSSVSRPPCFFPPPLHYSHFSFTPFLPPFLLPSSPLTSNFCFLLICLTMKVTH